MMGLPHRRPVWAHSRYREKDPMTPIKGCFHFLVPHAGKNAGLWKGQESNNAAVQQGKKSKCEQTTKCCRLVFSGHYRRSRTGSKTGETFSLNPTWALGRLAQFQRSKAPQWEERLRHDRALKITQRGYVLPSLFLPACLCIPPPPLLMSASLLCK